MKISIIKSKADNLVLFLLIVYAVYGISSVFFNSFPMQYLVIIILMAGLIALSSTLVSLVSIRWTGKLPKSILLMLILIACLLVAVAMQYLFLHDLRDNLNRSALGFTRIILVIGLCWLACGAAVQRLKIQKSFYLPLGIFLFLSSSVLVNLNDGLILSYAALAESRLDGLELNHLIVGESATLLIFMAFAFMPHAWRLLSFIISIGILFSLGGRSALFAYVLTIVFYILLKTPVHRLWPYLFGLILFASVLSAGFIPIDSNDDAIARMLLSQGLLGDSSAYERKIQFSTGFQHLLEQLLMGNPTFLISTFGSMGEYMHNIFSTWQFFGFFSFLSLLFSIIWVGFNIIKNRKNLNNPIDEFGIFIFLYAGISIFFTKYIGFPMIWFALGFWLVRLGSRSKQVSRLLTSAE